MQRFDVSFSNAPNRQALTTSESLEVVHEVWIKPSLERFPLNAAKQGPGFGGDDTCDAGCS